MNHFITGASGFIGAHLAEYLRRECPKDELFSIGRSASGPAGVTHFKGDLADTAVVTEIVQKVRPDRVYHLAGASRPSAAGGVHTQFESNFLTTLSLLKALETLNAPVRFFLASSAHVYGNQTSEVSEEAELHPNTAYGFSKFLAEQSTRKFAQDSPNFQVVVGRLYSCVGPAQQEGFVVSDFIRRISDLRPEDSVLQTGPLNSSRVFMDVRDVAELIPRLLAAKHPSRFEVYNIASQHYRSVEEVLRLLLDLAGKHPKVESSEDAASNAFSGIRVSAAKLEELLHPQFRPLEETLRDAYQAHKGHS